MPWLTPDEIPEGTVCRPLLIPDSTVWLAIVSGALTELTQSWNWEQAGAVTVDEAVERMNALVSDYYEDICSDCELPGGDPVVRLNEFGEYEQLIEGTWQEPQGDYAMPPVPAREELTADERRCFAAWNAEQMLHDTYEQITDSFLLGLTVLQLISTVSIFLISALFPAAGLLMRAAGALALGAWNAGFQVVEYVTSDFWDAQFTENMRCMLFRCSSDDAGVVTFDLDCINQELISQIEWLDPSASSFALAGQVRWMLTQLGGDVIDQMGATTEVEGADCSECDSPIDCHQWFDVATANGVTGDYTEATWTSLLDPDVQFTRVEIEYELRPNPGAVLVDATVELELMPSSEGIFEHVTELTGMLFWETSFPLNKSSFFIQLRSNFASGGSNYPLLTRVTFYYLSDPLVVWEGGEDC